MILLLYDKGDFDFLDFIAFLKKRNIAYAALDMKQLIQEVKIKSIISSAGKKCLWIIGNTHINFENVTGIYHSFSFPQDLYFRNFYKKDIDYCKEEWYAYYKQYQTYVKDCEEAGVAPEPMKPLPGMEDVVV